MDRPSFSAWRISIVRSFALFFGLFTLVNLFGEVLLRGFDANGWWIDLRFLAVMLSRVTLAISAIVLLGFGVRPPESKWRRGLTGTIAVVLGLVTLFNAAQFYQLLGRGVVFSGLPIALSLFIASGFLLITVDCIGGAANRAQGGQALRVIICLAGWMGMFPLLQTLCFGKTDYRRSADVAVVFGARAYADGTPSDALADRVRTGCELYQQGRVKKLIFSGGPGDGEVHETEAMRQMALSLGVKDQDILLDAGGLNTDNTVRHTMALFKKIGARRVLTVSHFYHLPRIKMAYQRQGMEVYTVPAKETYFLRQTPYSVAREVAAFWAYYLRPLAS
jgi:vancomycin permeability regulator SanA